MNLAVIRYTFAAVLLAMLFGRHLTAQDESGVRALEPGVPIERPISAGETHVYSLRLGVGQFIHIFISQRGVDVAAALVGPRGEKILEADSPASTQEVEWITHVAPASGEYRIEVRAVDKGAPPGRYEIKIEEQRESVPDDQGRLSAQRLLAEAISLYGENKPDSYRKAIEKYEQALALYRQAGRRREEAVTLNGAARAYASISDNKAALDYFGKALTIYREMRDLQGEGITLDEIGSVHSVMGRYGEAVEYFGQALAARRSAGYRAGEGKTLLSLGFAYRFLKQYEKAAACYRQAIEIWRESKDRAAEASALDSLAFTYWLSDHFDEAIHWYEQALLIHRGLKDRAGEAMTLDRMGFAYRKQEQTEAAVRCYEQLLVIKRESKDRVGEASTLDSIAFTYRVADHYDQAIRIYEQVLATYRELKDRAREAATLFSMGDTSYNSKQYENAVAYYDQALTIRRELKDRAGEASALKILGFTFGRLKQYQRSSDYYQQALAIYRELKDRRAEGNTLESMADSYANSGETEKAVGSYEQALVIWRETNDQNFEGRALWDIALIYEGLHDQQNAVRYYEQALAVRRRLGDRPGEALALTGLGRVYVWTDNEKASDYFEQVLAIQRATGDRRGQTQTLNLLGVVQAKLSHYDKELAYYEQALEMARGLKDRAGEGRALFTIASAYLRLHRSEAAIDYLEQALTMGRELKDRKLESRVLYGLGVAYTFLRQNEKALSYLDQSLVIAREVGDGESLVLAFEGAIYGKLGQQDKAIGYVERALALARKTKDRMDEANALIFLGVSYFKTKQLEKAGAYLEQALGIVREIKMRELEAETLGTLMNVWAERRQPRLAIVFGKQAINIFQEIRNDLPGLDQTMRQSFMQGKKSRYRQLADLLAGQGRLAEAQQVLGLLKEDEFTTFVVRDRNVGASEGRVTLTASEAEWEKRYQEIADRLTAIGVKRAALLAKAERSAADEKELASLESDLETGNRAFQAFLNNVESAGKSAGDQLARVREAEGLMETLRDLGHGSVAVYTIVGEQAYRAILITPDVQKGYSYPISAAELNKKILAFRELARNPNADPRPLGKELYDILVKPMEKDLEGAQAQTIMWSLDGALRYIPVAALYDGQRYLVERFRNVVFTPASQSRLKDPVSHDWRGLGLGVSLAHEGFQPLPNVPNELHAIIQSDPKAPQGILPGTVKLDSDFTKEGLRAELRKHYSIVHVASHFDFAPGTDQNSFLLLGDGGKLTLEEFRRMPQVLQGVELLTLSACDTAVGGEDADGKEVEGFAVLAQRQGAKAVVATLWAVADESTALLMKEFYRLRMSDASLTKAEALRQAQLALLTGKIRGAASAGRGPHADQGGEAAKFVNDPQRPYAHPYFWAPFLLMGNWK